MYNIYRFANKEVKYKHVSMPRRFTPQEEPEDREEPISYDNKLDNSLSRTRRLFMEYAYCNHFDIFCTFTFDSDKVDRRNYDEVKKKLCQFFNYHKKHYDRYFRYMIIPELHEDGCWHFHGFITLTAGMCSPLKIPKTINGAVRYVPNTPHYLSWPAYSDRFGFFSGDFIRDYESSIIYCTSYITKSFQLPEFKNKHLLLKSQGLDKPELVYKSISNVDLFQPDYKGDFCEIKWMDDNETSGLYRHWTYCDGENLEVLNKQWPLNFDVIHGEQVAVDI